MSELPKKCLVDTNVPITANRALDPAGIQREMSGCVLACVEAIRHVTASASLVLDGGDEIFKEYRNNLSLKGEPGLGDRFVKWVYDHQWNPQKVDRVEITKKESSYKEFPQHPDLTKFDDSDRKFIAVANAHPTEPPILQATDSKWWGLKDALSAVNINVHFLCPKYTEAMWKRKIRDKRKKKIRKR